VNGEDRKLLRTLANQQIGFEAKVETKLDNIHHDIIDLKKEKKDCWKAVTKVAGETLVNTNFREQHIIEHSDNLKNAIVIIGMVVTVVTILVNVGIALVKK